jgi:hypothetical protein
MAYYSAYMMYSRLLNLAQLFREDSDGFRSGLDDDGSDMEICGGVRGRGPFLGFSGWKGLIFQGFYPLKHCRAVNPRT